MQRLLALGFVLLLASQAMAQQKPQYTQYSNNNYLLNPAISGIENYADLKLGTRQQWSGLEGAPQTYYATFHMPINKDMTASYRGGRMGSAAKEETTKKPNRYRRIRPHHGIGAMAASTKTGPLKRGSLSFSYAYHQPLTKSLRVAAGVAPGLIQYSLDPGTVNTAQGNDPAIYDGRVNETKFDLNMGLWLYSYNFYVGVSGAQLVPSKRKYINDGTPQGSDGSLQQHYFATAAYRFDVMSGLAVIPSVMVKMAQPSPVSFDVSGKVLYADRIWAGAAYRHNESITAMAGMNISHLFDLAYSYDASTSPLGQANAGSHEVVLGFKLRNTRRIICPEWAW
ncbi:type IX secretion system membrane protein PorP/SprF [Pontibacter sp. KCTC 32443]|uniref:PorP/SprF family type IX secretion system membrane protein n=1 Tax=Pontibacter TaxID=323449 RepID=UPI00164D684A|nr:MULTISPECIES: type IX secretion system membrane protein PorP/SprF [Pontibacter]MBC5772955.1 type IX secretion system membrane protein PorP/SprF [Pontibacter sp. KCTC 32443]